MFFRVKRGLDSLVDHYTAACILLALFVLSLVGVGDVAVVSLLGFLLCMAGLTQRSAQVDLWILVPFLVYNLACMASACAVYGEIVSGYGITHGIFPVFCLLTACLDPDEQRLLKRLCALWTGAAAAVGIGHYGLQALAQGQMGRMSGLLGNPNAMGIFFVLGWFLVAVPTGEEGSWALARSLLEPLLLIAAAMTLSMGSFLAMAAGVLALLAQRKKAASWRETFSYACQILAKASLGMGTGLLIYLSAARTDVPWSCLFLLAYGAAVMLCWRRFEAFLEAKPGMAALISALGALVSAAAVLMRPNAVATFGERLEMMASGINYLTANPLLGVGPFQWRQLDLNDGGKYFNTWHIHNIPIHVGVEMGWIAMAALLLIGIRALARRQSPEERALTAAFIVHNLIDTSFFYLGVTALVLTAAGGSREEARRLGGGGLKLLFALFAGLFAWGLCVTLMMS